MASIAMIRDSIALYEEMARRSIQSQLDKLRMLEKKVELQKASLERCPECGLTQEEWNTLPEPEVCK
jgi:hypothetical protein